MPVVIVSSLTRAGSCAALQALEAGAVDVLAKPTSAWSVGELRSQLVHRVKGAAKARPLRLQETASTVPDVPVPATSSCFSPRQIVVMGASTGGTEALKNVLTQLPDGLPGICIVQHIPPVFSKTFADRLNEICAFQVREAVEGDELKPGLALIAPGDYHMAVKWKGSCYEIHLQQGPPLHFTRPAVDVLFNTAAAEAGPNALGVLLTGMGRDGAQGMQKLKAAGAKNIVQNEETCVVYGMPRAAVELGVVDQTLPLSQIPHAILQTLQAGAAVSPQQRATTGSNPQPVKTAVH